MCTGTHTRTKPSTYFEVCTAVETSIDLLKPFLIFIGEESNASLHTTRNTITPQTDKQTKTMTKHARQRITQSTCKLISLACKVKDLAGEQDGKKKLGKKNGAGQEKTADENKMHH